MTSIKNYKITKIEPQFVGLLNKPEIIKKAKELMTDREEHVISIDVLNVYPAIVNGIRRILIDELPIKALDFDIGIVTTTDEFIIAAELRDRIRFIPINQDIPENTTFQISEISKSELNIIYSSVFKSKYIPSKFRLAELKLGSHLNIPIIKVVTGMGRDDSMFSLTADIFYETLDYKDVDIINNKGNRLTIRVKTSDILEKGETEGSVFDKKILIYPTANHKTILSAEDNDRIKLAKYDKVLTKEIEEQSSLMVEPENYRLNIYLNGNITPENVIPTVCDNIIGRLRKVSDAIKNNLSNVEISLNPIEHPSINTVWVLKIFGETHTIGQLIAQAIFRRDPGISYCVPIIDHPTYNNIHIDIVHKEPQKITLDSINDVISIYESIKKQTSK